MSSWFKTIVFIMYPTFKYFHNLLKVVWYPPHLSLRIYVTSKDLYEPWLVSVSILNDKLPETNKEIWIRVYVNVTQKLLNGTGLMDLLYLVQYLGTIQIPPLPFSQAPPNLPHPSTILSIVSLTPPSPKIIFPRPHFY